MGKLLRSKKSNCVYVQDNSYLTITSIQGDEALVEHCVQKEISLARSIMPPESEAVPLQGGTVIAKGEYEAAGIGGDAWRTNDNFSISIEYREADGGWGGAGIETQASRRKCQYQYFRWNRKKLSEARALPVSESDIAGRRAG